MIPFCGHLFVFRGRRGDLLKMIWFDGQGACLFSKRLEKGRFVWPSAAQGKVTLTTGAIVDVAGGDRLARAGENMASVACRIVNILRQKHSNSAGLRFLQLPEFAINPHARHPCRFAR